MDRTKEFKIDDRIITVYTKYKGKIVDFKDTANQIALVKFDDSDNPQYIYIYMLKHEGI